MRKLPRYLAAVATLGLASAGIVAACHNDVPAPTLPIIPEVSPQGPRPEPITPIPTRVDQDAGIPLPTTPEPGAAAPRRAPPLRVAAVPPDAEVIPDVLDLPPVVDADVAIVSDAGQPLRPR